VMEDCFTDVRLWKEMLCHWCSTDSSKLHGAIQILHYHY